jgi:hypothetical protein
MLNYLKLFDVTLEFLDHLTWKYITPELILPMSKTDLQFDLGGIISHHFETYERIHFEHHHSKSLLYNVPYRLTEYTTT